MYDKEINGGLSQLFGLRVSPVTEGYCTFCSNNLDKDEEFDPIFHLDINGMEGELIVDIQVRLEYGTDIEAVKVRLNNDKAIFY